MLKAIGIVCYVLAFLIIFAASFDYRPNSDDWDDEFWDRK